MSGSTTYYSLTLPTVGGDADTWATYTNQNWVIVDTQLRLLQLNFLNLSAALSTTNTIIEGLQQAILVKLDNVNFGDVGAYTVFNYTGGITVSDSAGTLDIKLSNIAKRTVLGNSTTEAAAPTAVATTELWSILLNGTSNPSAYSANQNDLVLLSGGFADHTFFRLSATTPIDITGIVPDATNTGGKVIILVNNSANAITLKNSSASSAAANRFLFTADYVMQQDYTVTLLYDISSSKWRMIAKTP